MNREEFKKKMLNNDAVSSKIEVKKIIDDIIMNESPRTICIIFME